MAVGDKQFVLMASQLGTANGPAQLNSDSLLPILQGGTMAGNTQLALANLGAGVRPNLLDNAYFVGGGSQQGGGQFPINQRGETSYTSVSAAFTDVFDRWKMASSTVILSQNSFKLTFNTGFKTYSRFLQLTERTLRAGEKYTLSLLAKIDAASPRVVLRCCNAELSDIPGATKINLSQTDDIELFSVTLSPKSDQVGFGVEILDSGLNIGEFSGDIFAVKLEVGEGQTLAYQDSTGVWRLLPQLEYGDYTGQLARCQHYQMIYPLIVNGLYWPCIAQTESNAKMCVQLPASIRTLPIVKVDLDSVVIYDGLTEHSITGINVFTRSGNVVVLNLQTQGLTPGQSYQFRANQAVKLVLSANM